MLNICLVKISSMGDMIHFLPALTDMAYHLDAKFTWVCEKPFSEIPTWHFSEPTIVPINLRKWKKNPLSKATRIDYKAYKKQLAAQEFDYVLDVQGLLKTVFFVDKNAHGKVYGYDKHSVREKLAAHFYNTTISVPKDMHAITRMRVFCSKVFNYEVDLKVNNFGIEEFFNDESAPAEKYVVCLHGTSKDNKCWPEKYWLEIIEDLLERGYSIKLPWGNDNELKRAERLKISDQVTVLDKLSISDLGKLINNAAYTIALDSGLGHLASALKAPCVHLYGPTEPKLVGCYEDNQINIKENSMELIKPYTVLEYILASAS